MFPQLSCLSPNYNQVVGVGENFANVVPPHHVLVSPDFAGCIKFDGAFFGRRNRRIKPHSRNVISAPNLAAYRLCKIGERSLSSEALVIIIPLRQIIDFRGFIYDFRMPVDYRLILQRNRGGEIKRVAPLVDDLDLEVRPPLKSLILIIVGIVFFSAPLFDTVCFKVPSESL